MEKEINVIFEKEFLREIEIVDVVVKLVEEVKIELIRFRVEKEEEIFVLEKECIFIEMEMEFFVRL